MRTVTLASFLLGVAVLPAQDQDLSTPVATTLTQIRAEPDAYKDVKVVFTVQFASLGRISNPFFTKFTPTDYTNFYVWADEQPIWREGAYEDLFGTMFLSKFHSDLERLYAFETYDRIKVHGIIRDVFQDTPWIEVLSFEALESKLDTAVLTHLYRGEKLMEQRAWQRAIAELSLVPGGAVPHTALTSAYSNLGTCLLRIGEAKLAVTYLQSASDLQNGKDRQVESMLALARTEPAQAIDRTVDSRTLKDHERPIWEAFDSGDGKTTPSMQ